MKLTILLNGLSDGDYAEAYAGGAGIAWSLLFEEYVSRVHINDLSRPVYAFWHSVLYATNDLCRLINDTDVTMDQWHRQREIQARSEQVSLLELGFSTFFLNRTNRSGILKAGVIGGKNQDGPYKLDARFNKADLIARIKRIARYAGRIELYNLDAAKFISDALPQLNARSLVYFDPPYYHKGEELYENHYTHADHEAIAHLITTTVHQSWVVSYDSTPEIERLYEGYSCVRYKVEYSAQNRYAGSELIFLSPDLTVPPVGDPSKVKRKDLRTHVEYQNSGQTYLMI